MKNSYYINNYCSFSMKIVVQTLNQQTFDVVIDDNATLQTLKNDIGTIKDHQPDQIKIIFNGAVLDNNEKKLSEYKVVDGTKIVLLLQKTKPKVSAPAPLPTEDEEKTKSKPVPQPSLPPVGSVGPVAPGGPGAVAVGNGQNMAHAFGTLLQQNPQAFMQLLMGDPYINQLAQQNPQAFAQIIGDPNFVNNVIAAGEGFMAQGGEDEEMYGKVFSGNVELTAEQKKEVQDIVDMGFPFEEVIQLYVAYGHSKELTVNALFDEQLDGDMK